jgi:hypothetical protein
MRWSFVVSFLLIDFLDDVECLVIERTNAGKPDAEDWLYLNGNAIHRDLLLHLAAE